MTVTFGHSNRIATRTVYGRRPQIGGWFGAIWALAPSVLAASLTITLTSSAAVAQRLENRVAVFAALDKVTATIKRLAVPLNETVEYGALKVTPRVCYSRPPTEAPKTTSFVEVDEVQLDGQQKRIFSGWMFAESPGLNAVEHPVFDVWLTGCEQPVDPAAARTAVAPSAGTIEPGTDAAVDGTPASEEEIPRRRVRR